MAEVRESAALFHLVEQKTAELRGLLDSLCGLRWHTVGMKQKDRAEFERPLFRMLALHPADAYKLLARGPEHEGDVPADCDALAWSEFVELWRKTTSIADKEGFLHWEVAFPGIWRDWQSTRPQGGFDAVIGNPPWDRIKLQEVEWFATRDTEIALAPTAAARGKGIQRLRKQGSPLAAEFDEAKHRADRLGEVIRASGHYPLLSGGDINLYSPVRREGYESDQAGWLRRPVDAVWHLRRQDCGSFLPVRFHKRDGWAACSISRTAGSEATYHPSSRTWIPASNSAP